MKRYIVHPCYVKSIIDGDLHFITGKQLINLYKLNPEEVIISSIDAPLVGTDLNLYIHLYPSHSGNYVLDKPRREYYYRGEQANV